MADYDYQSFSKRIPTLSRDNHEIWFRQMTLKLKSKGIFFATEGSLLEYAGILRGGPLDGIIETEEKEVKRDESGKAIVTNEMSVKGDDGVADTAEISQIKTLYEKMGYVLHIEKAKTFKKAEASCLSLMCESLSPEDQELIDEHQTANLVWSALVKTYQKTFESTATEYASRIAMFVFDESMTIDSAWSLLKGYRRRMGAADVKMKAAFDDNVLFTILTKKLPAIYTTTIDGFRTNRRFTIAEKVQMLTEVEAEHKPKEGKNSKTQEEAHAARDYRGKNKSRRGGGYQSQSLMRKDSIDSLCKEDNKTDKRLSDGCYLCGVPHPVSQCPKLRLAQRLLKKYDACRRQKKDSRPEKPYRKSYEAKDHAHQADEDNAESYDEDSGLESEAAHAALDIADGSGKRSPWLWPADTAATSHMSDQPDLFRFLKPIKWRRVKVGGGFLWAKQRGEAKLACEDGTYAWLKDALLVEGLGVNLLSARRLCDDGLEGKFDAKSLWLTRGSKRIVHAVTQRGLYLVINVVGEDPAFGKKNITRHEERGFAAEDSSASVCPVSNSPESVSEDDGVLGELDKERYLRYHERFSHLSPKIINHLHLVTDLKKRVKIPHDKGVCEVCKTAKLRNRVSKLLSPRPSAILALVQCDIAGPFPTSLRGNRWYLMIVDKYSCRNWVCPLSSKDQAKQALQVFKVREEKQTAKKLLAGRSDNAPELLQVINGWRDEDGVVSQHTTIASSHQNGAAERNIQTSEAGMRALLAEAELPLEFWDEAILADAYMRNRVETGPTVNPDEDVLHRSRISPYEAYYEKIPSIKHIRKWGSKCYYYVDRKTIPAGQRTDKLVNPGRVGVFMGYSENTEKHFRVYSPERGYTIEVSVVEVDEKTKGGTVDLKLRTKTMNQPLDRKPRGRPSKTPVAVDSGPAIPPKAQDLPTISSIPEDSPLLKGVDTPGTSIPASVQAEVPVVNTTSEDLPDAPASITTPEMTPESSETQDSPQPVVSEPTGGDSEPPIPLSKDDTTDPSFRPANKNQPPPSDRVLRDRKRKSDVSPEKLDSAAEPRKIQKMIHALIATLQFEDDMDEVREILGEAGYEAAFLAGREFKCGIEIPLTYKQAIQNPWANEWRAAMAEEMLALHANETFEEVIPPEGANLVSMKWVYDIKPTVDGKVERFKARLVARGFTQVHGIDYSETFAPTARMDTLRLILATVAKEDLECYHFDIKNAFTESHLKEDIYFQPPLNVGLLPGRVWKALRSLYGLKQAARNWNKLMVEELLKWGFVQSLADPCLFTHEKRGIKLLLYVDDLAVAAKTVAEIKWFEKVLLLPTGRFNGKNLGEISKILGARVTRDRKSRTLYLDQEQYLTSVLDKFGITHAKHHASSVPITDLNLLAPALETEKRIDLSTYQKQVGSIMYACVFTRPDIAFVLGKLCQYMSDPVARHGTAMKALFRYIKSTVKQKIRYGLGGSHDAFAVYTDADWAADKTDRKSVSGSVVMFYGGPISWSSKKQRSVSTSSCESEYIAQATASKHGQWVAQIFRDLKLPRYIGGAVKVFGDNQGAIALAKNAQLNERSKHIDICYHFVRDLHEKGLMDLSYISTKEMVADGCTKALARVDFAKFKKLLGLMN